MSKNKSSRQVTAEVRRKVFDRDGGKCARCAAPLTLSMAKIDLIRHAMPPDKRLPNLRLLCRRCDVLRLRPNGQPDIAGALRDGVIGPTWRQETWEDLGE